MIVTTSPLAAPSPARRRTLMAALPWAVFGIVGATTAQPVTAAGFDHRHKAWDALLKQHVVIAPGGNASTVRYAALQDRHGALDAYLKSLSAVSAPTYAGWSRSQQLAFLINAYNAFTVALILTRYPDLESIKDLGSFLQSPWKKRFFRLLDRERSLDEIEHEMIRAPGAFDDPPHPCGRGLRLHRLPDAAQRGLRGGPPGRATR